MITVYLRTLTTAAAIYPVRRDTFCSWLAITGCGLNRRMALLLQRTRRLPLLLAATKISTWQYLTS